VIILAKTEIVGCQKTLLGGDIQLIQYKDYEKKQQVKKDILAKFNGSMIRSIIRGKDLKNRDSTLDRLQKKEGESDIDYEIRRADTFGKKTMETLSIFPSIITTSYVSLLSKEGDYVFDPFAGHNSRGEDVVSLNRKYFAYDIHTFPIEFTKKALSRFPVDSWELVLGSSEKVKYEDSYFDFIITCPPYGDVEDYNSLYKENKSDDLSSIDYPAFLIKYESVLKECFRVLKPNRFMVIVVGNIFRDKEVFNLMGDTIHICLKAGFKLHDINIYDRGSNIGGDLNYNLFINELKRFPQIHEYILVFRKGSLDINALNEPRIEILIKEWNITDEQIKMKLGQLAGMITREGAVKLIVNELKKRKVMENGERTS
jgi:DNA modification methylase